MALPGDEIIEDAAAQSTRAITAVAVFEMLTLMQPSPIVSLPFVVSVWLIVRRPRRREAST